MTKQLYATLQKETVVSLAKIRYISTIHTWLQIYAFFNGWQISRMGSKCFVRHECFLV